jgi:hypothetical protein
VEQVEPGASISGIISRGKRAGNTSAHESQSFTVGEISCSSLSFQSRLYSPQLRLGGPIHRRGSVVNLTGWANFHSSHFRRALLKHGLRASLKARCNLRKSEFSTKGRCTYTTFSQERQRSIPHKTRNINLIILNLNEPILLLTFSDSSQILHASTMLFYLSIHSVQMTRTAVFCKNRLRTHIVQ